MACEQQRAELVAADAALQDSIETRSAAAAAKVEADAAVAEAEAALATAQAGAEAANQALVAANDEVSQKAADLNAKTQAYTDCVTGGPQPLQLPRV